MTRIQAHLFELGADLASPSVGQTVARIQAPLLTSLEKEIDEQDAKLPPLTSFILPGGSPAAAQLHLARAACRRAERAVVTLAEGQPIGALGIAYLNRLSDLLFVLARATNLAHGVQETKWTPQRPGR